MRTAKKVCHSERSEESTGVQAKRVSNGLSGELTFWVFREVIEEEDEFTHDGDEGEFLGFADSHGRSKSRAPSMPASSLASKCNV